MPFRKNAIFCNLLWIQQASDILSIENMVKTLYTRSLGAGNFIHYFILLKLFNKQYQTEQIDFMGTRENSLLYQVIC